jgi:hypothetical protein
MLKTCGLWSSLNVSAQSVHEATRGAHIGKLDKQRISAHKTRGVSGLEAADIEQAAANFRPMVTRYGYHESMVRIALDLQRNATNAPDRNQPVTYPAKQNAGSLPGGLSAQAPPPLQNKRDTHQDASPGPSESACTGSRFCNSDWLAAASGFLMANASDHTGYAVVDVVIQSLDPPQLALLEF